MLKIVFYISVHYADTHYVEHHFKIQTYICIDLDTIY